MYHLHPKYILGNNYLPQYRIFLGPLFSEVVWVDRVRRNPKGNTEVHFSPKLRHSDKSNNRAEKFHSSLKIVGYLFKVVKPES